MSRRSFLALAAMSLKARTAEHGMPLHLSCGALGIRPRSGRWSISPPNTASTRSMPIDGKYLGGLSDSELHDLLGYMQSKKIAWALGGLPVGFRRDDATFTTGMAAFPAFARGFERAGVRRVTTYVLPMSNDRPYLANLELHDARLREAVRVRPITALAWASNTSPPKRCGRRSAIPSSIRSPDARPHR